MMPQTLGVLPLRIVRRLDLMMADINRCLATMPSTLEA
jgi:hypothetical protein